MKKLKNIKQHDFLTTSKLTFFRYVRENREKINEIIEVMNKGVKDETKNRQ